jgi:RecA/RadA recombinase
VTVTADDAVLFAATIASELLGEADSSDAGRLRFGSISINLAKGTYYDDAADEGGTLLELIRQKKGFNNGEVEAWINSVKKFENRRRAEIAIGRDLPGDADARRRETDNRTAQRPKPADAIAPPPGPEETRFALEMLDEIAVADDPIELIQGLLPMGPALGVVFGPPKSLKSFLLMHIALHIAASRPYCGRTVQGGATVYVTSEGIRGVKRRLIAGRRAMGIEGQHKPFALVSAMPNLGAGQGDRAALQQNISETLAAKGITAPLRLIVIDTMRRSMPGKSENEQKDVSVVVDNCEALARAFGCLVILVHHSPRSNDQRGSGSNALDAAADFMMSVIRPDASSRSATASIVHYKDGEEGDTWTFELCPTEIGIDRNGNPIMSCSVDVTAEPERKITAAKSSSLSPAQQRVFDIVVTACIDDGVAGLAGDAAPPGTRAVTREILKGYAKSAGWWDDSNDKSSRTKFGARLNELARKRAIGLTAAHIWPARAP